MHTMTVTDFDPYFQKILCNLMNCFCFVLVCECVCVCVCVCTVLVRVYIVMTQDAYTGCSLAVFLLVWVSLQTDKDSISLS